MQDVGVILSCEVQILIIETTNILANIFLLLQYLDVNSIAHTCIHVCFIIIDFSH